MIPFGGGPKSLRGWKKQTAHAVRESWRASFWANTIAKGGWLHNVADARNTSEEAAEAYGGQRVKDMRREGSSICVIFKLFTHSQVLPKPNTLRIAIGVRVLLSIVVAEQG